MTTRTRRTGRLLAGVGVAAIAVALGLVTAAPAYAAAFNVTDGSSSGPGTLTQAILDLNASGTAGTITIDPGLVIDMGAVSTQVHQSVIVLGDPADPATIQGPTAAAPIFQMANPDLSIEVDDVHMIGAATGGSAITMSGGSGSVVLGNDTFTNFVHPAVELLLQTGDLTVTGCTFSGNASNAADADGGAIVAGSVGDVAITNSTFSNNAAGHHGGALFLGDAHSVNISDSSFDSNHATDDGGAVEITSLSADSIWQGDTFTGNTVGSTNFAGGAAFFVFTVFANVTLTIDQSSFSGNSAVSGLVPTRGAVGYVDDVEGTVLLSGSTMTGNSFGGTQTGTGLDLAVGIIGDIGELDVLQSTLDETGADNPLLFAGNNNHFLRLASSTFFGPGVLQVSNSNPAVNGVEARDVVAISTDATPAFDVTGTPAEIGYSITSDTANAQLVGLLGMHFGVVDPQLGPLADNGGPTQTRLPFAGSLAIDAGDPGFTVPLTDQRGTGFPRILNGRVDIGSVEGTSTTAPALSATGTDPVLAAWSAMTTLATGALLLGALALLRRRNTAQQTAGRR